MMCRSLGFQVLKMVKTGDLIEKWEIKKRISKGTFGEIFIGRDVCTGSKYAVKIQTELEAGLKVSERGKS